MVADTGSKDVQQSSSRRVREELHSLARANGADPRGMRQWLRRVTWSLLVLQATRRPAHEPAFLYSSQRVTRRRVAWKVTEGAFGGLQTLNVVKCERSLIMKRSINYLVLSLALVVGMAVSTASAQEHSRSILLKRDAKVGAQVLPKGEYALKYSEGKDELVILQGKREIISATYKVTKLDKAATDTLVVYSQEADGSFLLKRIEFKGKDSALVLENAVAKAIAR